MIHEYCNATITFTPAFLTLVAGFVAFLFQGNEIDLKTVYAYLSA
jgi:hypothetical protein